MPLDPDSTPSYPGISLSNLRGVGFLTNGDLGFKSPFPLGATQFRGMEATIDWNRSRYDGTADPIGRLALMYYWGHSKGRIDQNFLPLDDGPISRLVRFSSEREAHSDFVLAEWRWPSSPAVHRSTHWSLIHPEFGVGVGGFSINTRIIQGEGSAATTTEERSFLLVTTGSTRVHLVQFRWKALELSLAGGVRVFAGEAFGMMGEGGLRIAWTAPL